MDVQNQPCVAPQTGLSQPPSKTSRLSKNDQKWNYLKEEIRRLYVEGKNTLPATMQSIEERHGFKASVRKWKMKLKEWGYDKYLSTTEMQIVIAKAEKRAREEGKETMFFHGESQITTKRIENFKKRKLTKELEVASPSAETPANVTYYTPHPENEPYPLDDLLSSTAQDYSHHLGELASLESDFSGLNSTGGLSPYVASAFLADGAPNYILAQEAVPFDVGTQMISESISRSKTRSVNKISGVAYQGMGMPAIPRYIPHSDTLLAEIGIPTAKQHQFPLPDSGFLKWRDFPGFPVAPRESAVNPKNFQSVWSIPTINGDIDDSAASVTLAEASIAFSLGRSHQATGKLSDAVSEFFRAIDLFTQVTDKRSLKLLDALINVTEICRDQDLLPEYISACQQLLAWKKEIFGEISPNSLQSTFELAKVLFETSMYSEAEVLFREALAGFKSLRMNQQYLQCQRFLGESLRYLGRYAEAESHLVSVLAWCVQRGSKDLMILVLTSLEIIYSKRGPSHSMLAARSSNALLLLGSQLTDIWRYDKGTFPEETILAIADLASGYSSLWDPELAHVLYMPLSIQFGRKKSKPSAERLLAYHEYAAHLTRQGRCADATRFLYSFKRYCRGVRQRTVEVGI